MLPFLLRRLTLPLWQRPAAGWGVALPGLAQPVRAQALTAVARLPARRSGRPVRPAVYHLLGAWWFLCYYPFVQIFLKRPSTASQPVYRGSFFVFNFGFVYRLLCWILTSRFCCLAHSRTSLGCHFNNRPTSTCGGVLPLAIGMNEPGREVQGPMAVVILGGLLTSMVLNLLVLPTLALRYGRFESTPDDLLGA